jgi:hypothetical protein
MLKHIVFMKFREGVTTEQVEELKKGLGGLPAKIPEIKEWAFGADILRTERSVDFALVSAFGDPEALKRYQVHPDHIPVLNLVRSLSESIQAADFNWP